MGFHAVFQGTRGTTPDYNVITAHDPSFSLFPSLQLDRSSKDARDIRFGMGELEIQDAAREQASQTTGPLMSNEYYQQSKRTLSGRLLTQWRRRKCLPPRATDKMCLQTTGRKAIAHLSRTESGSCGHSTTDCSEHHSFTHQAETLENVSIR